MRLEGVWLVYVFVCVDQVAVAHELWTHRRAAFEPDCPWHCAEVRLGSFGVAFEVMYSVSDCVSCFLSGRAVTEYRPLTLTSNSFSSGQSVLNSLVALT